MRKNRRKILLHCGFGVPWTASRIPILQEKQTMSPGLNQVLMYFEVIFNKQKIIYFAKLYD